MADDDSSGSAWGEWRTGGRVPKAAKAAPQSRQQQAQPLVQPSWVRRRVKRLRAGLLAPFRTPPRGAVDAGRPRRLPARHGGGASAPQREGFRDGEPAAGGPREQSARIGAVRRMVMRAGNPDVLPAEASWKRLRAEPIPRAREDLQEGEDLAAKGQPGRLEYHFHKVQPSSRLDAYPKYGDWAWRQDSEVTVRFDEWGLDREAREALHFLCRGGDGKHRISRLTENHLAKWEAADVRAYDEVVEVELLHPLEDGRREERRVVLSAATTGALKAIDEAHLVALRVRRVGAEEGFQAYLERRDRRLAEVAQD